jgi:large subunit ribosomal protein L25
MKPLEINATKREVLGKKVRALRRAGVTPAHLYGQGVEPLAIQIDSLALGKVISKAGTSRLISLKMDGDSQPRNVLVKEVQTDHLGETVIHLDLFQVSMTEKIKVRVPVILTGEAPAVKAKLGTVMQNMRTLEVACLPANIPSSLEVDLSVLVELDDSIHVRDMKPKEGISIVSDPDDLIVKVGMVRVHVEEAPKPAEAVAAAEGEAAEGAAPAEGAEGAAPAKEGAKADAGAAPAEKEKKK